MKKTSFFKAVRSRLGGVLAAVAWVVVWQIVAMAVAKPYVLASPIETLQTLLTLGGTFVFWQSVLSSAGNILLGFFAALLLGIVAAAVASRVRFVRVLLSPLVLVVKSVPVASFIILVLIWVGTHGLAALISFLMVFPVIYTNLLTGLDEVPESVKRTVQVFHVSTLDRALVFYRPSVSPHLYAGCRVGLGLCWKAGVAAEVIGMAGPGIGEQLYYAKMYFDTASLFAYTLCVVLLSYACEKLVLFLLVKMEEVLRRAG